MAFRLFLARPQVNASCSGTADIEQRAINTRNYPGNFDNYGQCTWLISFTQSIKLVFTSFSVESGHGFLFVYDGTSTSSTLIGKYDGHLAGHVVESSGKHLFLEFTSDGNVTQSGFLINIEGRGVLFVSGNIPRNTQIIVLNPKCGFLQIIQSFNSPLCTFHAYINRQK